MILQACNLQPPMNYSKKKKPNLTYNDALDGDKYIKKAALSYRESKLKKKAIMEQALLDNHFTRRAIYNPYICRLDKNENIYG